MYEYKDVEKQSGFKKYEGDFLEGRFTGEGTLTWPNGDEYRGQIKNSRMHGEGILILKEKNQ